MLESARKIFFQPKYYSLVVLIILISTVLAYQQFFNKRVEAENKKIKKITQATNLSILGSLVASPMPLQTPLPAGPTLQPTIPPKSSNYPQVVNLQNWKLTLPIGSSKHPTEIKQPGLSAFMLDPWFKIMGGGLHFRAPVNGVTTSGSSYPRSELREMSGNGTINASWSSNSGIHTMFLDQAITVVPRTKRHVVAGQIHDAGDDVLVIRLEYPNLYVNVGGKNVYTLDSNYTLGRRFNVKFVVNNGQTKIYYNGSSTPVYVLDRNYSGAYFKAGAYTQSNCSKEDSLFCNDENFGEVVVYQVNVVHQ